MRPSQAEIDAYYEELVRDAAERRELIDLNVLARCPITTADGTMLCCLLKRGHQEPCQFA